MLSENQASYTGSEAAGFLLLRTPLLPFQEYVDVVEREVAASHANRKNTNVSGSAEFSAIMSRPMVVEAILLASTDLHSTIDCWRSSPQTGDGPRIERALRRYVARMSFRATPFGLFAGCSMAVFAERSALHLVSRDRYERRTRLDGGVLLSVIEEATRASDGEWPYVVNPSLTRRLERLEYVKSQLLPSLRRNTRVSIMADEPLLAVLDRATDGATVESVKAIIDEYCDDPDEVLKFIKELIDEQVLVPDVAIALTSDDSAKPLLVGHLALHPVIQTVGQVEMQLRAIDESGSNGEADVYLDALAPLRKYGKLPDVSHAVQCDLWKPFATDASLGRHVLLDIERAVDLLHSLHRPRATPLDAAVDAFQKRFERQEVPLEEALDEEVGIGFRWIDQPASPTHAVEESLADQHLLDCYRRLVAERRSTLDFRDDDARRCAIPHGLALPDAFIASGSLVAKSTDAVDADDFTFVLDGTVGPSGAQLLARFCDLDDRLRKATAAFLDREASYNEDAVYAEIVHQPGGRVSNLVRRPRLREHEIWYFGKGSGDCKTAITTDDLRLSLSGRRFVLRSIRLNREVVPRLSSAHRWDNEGNMPVYQFLAAVQAQSVTPHLKWSWGALRSAQWLPRVRSGRVVLSRERWRIGSSELLSPGGQAGVVAFDRFRSRLGKWTEDNRLPDWVVMREIDNCLPIRLGDLASERWLFDCLQKGRDLTIEEMLPGPGNLCVRGPEGRFTSEIVVPLLRRKGEGKAGLSRLGPLIFTSRSTRSFPPGTEWCYVKLFTGRATADRILRDHVAAFLEDIAQRQLSECAFVVRYADPDFHLRLRVRTRSGSSPSLVQSAVGAFAYQLFADGFVYRVQFDTYEREIERYGGDLGMDRSEQVFAADSRAVMKLLRAYGADDYLEQRWLVALLGVEQLFRDFGIVGEQCVSVLSRSADGSAELRKQSNREYRARRRPIEEALHPHEQHRDPRLNEAHAIFAERSHAIHESVAILKQEAAVGRLSVSLESLAVTHSHMFLNRLRRDNTGEKERLLHGILERYVRGQLARAKVTALSEAAAAKLR